MGHKNVVRAAEHQGVHLPWPRAKAAHGLHVAFAQRAGFRGIDRAVRVSGGQGNAALNGVRQTVAGLHHKMGLVGQRGHELAELGAGQRAPGADDTHMPCLGHDQSGLHGGLQAYQGQFWVAASHLMDGGCRGGIACHHQGLDVVLLAKIVGDGVGARRHKGVAALAVGGIGTVGQVHEALVGHGGQQGAQHAQPADAAVKHTDRRRGLRHQEARGWTKGWIVGKRGGPAAWALELRLGLRRRPRSCRARGKQKGQRAGDWALLVPLAGASVTFGCDSR